MPMTSCEENIFYCHACNQKMEHINMHCSLCNSTFIEIYDPLEHDLHFSDSLDTIIRLLDGLRESTLEFPSTADNSRLQEAYRNQLFHSIAAVESALSVQTHSGVHLKCFKNQMKLTCSVCINDIFVGEKAVKLICKHIFHKNCIYKWVRVQKSCPICRKNIEE